jgi:hypothetical protein
MIGIIVVIAWGALRFVHTNAGPTVMRWVAWLISFVIPSASQEQIDTGEAITGLAALPQYLQNAPLPY